MVVVAGQAGLRVKSRRERLYKSQIGLTRGRHIEGVSGVGLDVAGRGGRGANDIRGQEEIVLKVCRRWPQRARHVAGRTNADERALFGNSRPPALLTTIDVTLYVRPMGLNYNSHYILQSKVHSRLNGLCFSHRLARYIQTLPNQLG